MSAEQARSHTWIGMVRTDVPIGQGVVSLEIERDGCRVWDAATYSDCGEWYPLAKRDHLLDIPYFDQVYRHLVDQYTANRSNPLGRFLASLVEAMDLAICERQGTRVYFVQAGNRIKIGWSGNVAARLAQLQTANAEPVRLLAATPGSRSLERRLHDRFAHARLSGEWFEAVPELLAFIDDLSTAAATKAPE